MRQGHFCQLDLCSGIDILTLSLTVKALGVCMTTVSDAFIDD